MDEGQCFKQTHKPEYGPYAKHGVCQSRRKNVEEWTRCGVRFETKKTKERQYLATGLYRDRDSAEPGGSQQSLNNMVTQRAYNHAMPPEFWCLWSSEDSYIPK